MKRILLLQLSLLVTLLAQAWTYPRDNSLLYGLSYDIASGNKSAKVLKHPTGKYSGVVTIPASIKVTIKDGEEPVEVPVTEINGGAFSGCTELTEIHIPASVTKIWKEAFAGCTGLKKVHMESIAQACTTQYEQANANPLWAGKHLYIDGKEVTDLTIPSTVTSIGQYALVNCEGITSVTIPASVVKIGTDAFKGCTNLATSTFASVESLCKTDFGSLTANPLYLTHKINAGGKTDITTLSIPATSIRDVGGKRGLGGYILAGATNLMNVTIPDGVKTIGPSAFKDCTGLQTVTFPSKVAVTSIDYADETANPLRYASILLAGGEAVEELEINQAEVGKNAFAYCKGLKKLTFKQGVVKIGENAFFNCTNLEKIELPSTLDSIGQSAFNGCQRLTDFDMPVSLKGIGKEAFRDCKSLTKVTVPEGCELKFGVFRHCSNLETATLPASLSEISESMFENCSKLKNVVMPGAVQIGKKAFYNCSALELFPQSDNLTSISNEAFAYCKSLKTLNLAEKGQLANIGNSAFEGCTGLTALTLPATLVYIGSNAFKGDSALTQVFCEATTAPGIDNAAFDGKEAGMTLYVPEGATGYNSKSPWLNFTKGGTIKETTLTFYLNDEEIEEWRITQKSGTAVSKESHPNVNSRLSSTEKFMGWSADIPETMPNEDMAFYGYKSDSTIVDGYYYMLYPAEVKNGKQARATLMKIVKELNENETTIKLADQVSKGQTYPVTVIASKAFEKDSIISYLYLPSTLQSIEAEAFKGCRSLTAVYQFPSSITQIADGLFENCPALTSIFVGSETKQSALPDGITKIGNSAFRGCGSLQLAKLPASLNEVGVQAFRGNGFQKLVIPASVEILGIEAFRECGNLKEVEFEEGTRVKSLTDGVFLSCRSLEKVTLRGTTELGKSTFEGCSSLTNIFLPEGVSKIGQHAFRRCTALSNIVLPSTVEYIGTKVFEASGNIKQVTVLRNEAPFAVNDAFEDFVCQRAILYVPDTAKYKGQEPWSKFKNKVARKEYKLTYILDGTNYGEPKNVMAGSVVTAEKKPDEREFSGWQGEPDVMPAADVKVTGRRQYLIKYYDGTKDEAHRLLKDEKFAFFYGDTITIPVEELKKKDHKIRLTGLMDNNQVVEEDKVAELQKTMPARDLNVIVSYQHSEQGLTLNGIEYKVFIIDNYAEVVKGDDSKETVTIHNNVTYNGKNYPVTVIGTNAFKDFKKLKRVTLPDNLTTIGDYAFFNCTQLTGVTLPAKLASIGSKAFDHCQQLTEITIPASVKQMGSEVFVWCTHLTDVTIRAAISTLPERTFQNCKNLIDITIPSQIKTIGGKAFEGCDQLGAVTFSEGLKHIGDGAFNGCPKIRILEIPTSVETIGDNAFYGVFGNETNEDGEEVPDEIILKGQTLPTAQHTTFDEGAYDKAVLKTNISVEGVAPWDGFPVKPISEGTSTGTTPCETPVITYKGGNITVTCATPDATIYCNVTVADNQRTIGKTEIELSKTYVVTAYAKKDGMSKSQTATKTLTLDQGDVNGDGKVTAHDASLILESNVNHITVKELIKIKKQ